MKFYDVFGPSSSSIGLIRYLCSWQDVYAQMESFACRTYQTCPGLGFVLLKTETAKIDCKTTML